MYGQYVDLDSSSLCVRPAAVPAVLVSKGRERSLTMNDSDGRSNDGPCGYRIATCGTGARFGCGGLSGPFRTALRIEWRRLGVPESEPDCAQ